MSSATRPCDTHRNASYRCCSSGKSKLRPRRGAGWFRHQLPRVFPVPIAEPRSPRSPPRHDRSKPVESKRYTPPSPRKSLARHCRREHIRQRVDQIQDRDIIAEPLLLDRPVSRSTVSDERLAPRDREAARHAAQAKISPNRGAGFRVAIIVRTRGLGVVVAASVFCPASVIDSVSESSGWVDSSLAPPTCPLISRASLKIRVTSMKFSGIFGQGSSFETLLVIVISKPILSSRQCPFRSCGSSSSAVSVRPEPSVLNRL